MKKFKRSVIFLSFLLTATAQAANLFVEPDGPGIDCTSIDPCAHIQTAIDVSQPGDAIYVSAGMYYENLTIPVDKTGIKITGDAKQNTLLIAPDLAPTKFAPPGVPAEIVIDIFAPDVKVSNLTIRHAEQVPDKRDIGIFIRPPAGDVSLEELIVERLRLGDNLEPTTPGSRGVLVFRATGTRIEENAFYGNYEDHIHLPTSETHVEENIVDGATRLGIVVIQETETSLSTNNVIEDNIVINSGSDGIQIQGDENVIEDNQLENNGGVGIRLCGLMASPACVPPGQTATSHHNKIEGNAFKDNALGSIVDDGHHNMIRNEPFFGIYRHYNRQVKKFLHRTGYVGIFNGSYE